MTGSTFVPHGLRMTENPGHVCPSRQCVAIGVIDLDPKSPAYSAHPVPLEGRIAIVTDVGAGCGGRGLCHKTNDAAADGEAVWS